MLSIIISSYNSRFFNALEQNIKDTCGIIYELIRIENPGKMNINEAYNLGIKQSNYEYLLFIHEDISFETPKWGLILTNLFANQPDVGLIGIAGSKFKTKAPSGWAEAGHEFNELFIKQYDGESIVEDLTINYAGPSYEQVAVLDGVFLATRKSDNLFFDETLEGFHNYDIALSLRNRSANKKALVSFEIIVKHFSQGNYGHDWVRSAHQFYRKYKDQLPFCLPTVANSSEIEKVVYYRFFNKCFYYGEWRISFYYIIETFRHFPFSRLSYTMLLKFLYRLPQVFRKSRS